MLHPPVNVDYYTPDPAVAREPFVLYAGRLVPYKRPEIAVRAAERAGIDIVIAGEGRALADCQAVAGPHTRFAGRPSDTELLQLYRSCSALLMPGEEDFGIVPVEAQACGAPVVAIDAGGARDIVIPGETGLLVDRSHRRVCGPVRRGAAAAAVDRLRPAVIRMNAERFSQANFREDGGCGGCRLSPRFWESAAAVAVVSRRTRRRVPSPQPRAPRPPMSRAPRGRGEPGYRGGGTSHWSARREPPWRCTTGSCGTPPGSQQARDRGAQG